MSESRQSSIPDIGLSAPIVSLDWLRGIASLMVCIFHVKKYIWWTFNPNWITKAFEQGYLGVYIFFIVSGFVIPYSMYVKNYQLKSFWKYIAKRTVRIEPPYVIFIMILLIWNYWLFHFRGQGKEILYDAKQFILNVTYLAPFFGVKWIIVIFWTLAVEFQFYILTGLTYNLLLKKASIRYTIMLALIGIGMLIPEKYFTVLNYYVFFALGFQTFLFVIKRIEVREYLLSAAAGILFIYFYVLDTASIAALFTLLGIFYFNVKTKVSDFFGKISYSLYLTHGLVGGAVGLFTIKMFSQEIRFSLAIVISIAFAFLYYVSVEKIFLKISKRIKY
ncbi:MAG TPA: acyltransferase [Bacteroidia bacterium]|jgi:peptidoglycan/LPS O-acetylase OafA/YrhL|nr:acyltransferase [Bacteroidia bacterium]HQF27187.1 acyltransferase [Bacteroidia bacterium]HQK96529.1 acyltransferase [Bacteroidia bacterium]